MAGKIGATLTEVAASHSV